MPPIVNREEFALPTIYQAFRMVERYGELLAQNGIVAAPSSILKPIDVLAIQLLMAMMPTPPVMVDLAGGESFGASTVLGRCGSRARLVISLRPTFGADWPRVIEEFQARLDPAEVCPLIEVGMWEEMSRHIQETTPVMVLIPTTNAVPDELLVSLNQILSKARHAVVVLLSLGQTGECELLSRLAAKGDPVHCFTLMRERAAAFHDCGLGLLFRRDHPDVQSVLRRIRLVFTGNFSHLNMIRRACERAIEISQDEREGSMTALGQTRHALAIREYELAEIRNSIAFKVSRKLQTVRKVLAPQNSVRHRFFGKMARAAQILRNRGIRGLLGKLRGRLIAGLKSHSGTTEFPPPRP